MRLPRRHRRWQIMVTTGVVTVTVIQLISPDWGTGIIVGHLVTSLVWIWE